MKKNSVSAHLQEKMSDPSMREELSLQKQKLEVVKKLIVFRIEQKMTQKQLAKWAGVSQQHISKIECGIFSNIATLEKLLALIGYAVKIEIVPIKKQAAA